MTPPTAEQIQQAWEDPKLANLLYHDWEADTYDDKWSISFDERCISYATDRFRNVAGEQGWPYGSALELGCGTGFFLLNLKLGGVLDDGHVTDLSPGMVDVAKRNGTHLGFELEGRVADAETLPYPDESFDLVIGHAVLHHIPDLEQALREVMRVLKPGGRFVFAGEPTAKGDFVARKLSQLTWSAAKRITHLPGLRDGYARSDAELDDPHVRRCWRRWSTSTPSTPRNCVRCVSGSGRWTCPPSPRKFTASWFGWPVRTVEAAVKPGALGWWAPALRVRDMARAVRAGREGVQQDRAQYFYNVSVTGIKA